MSAMIILCLNCGSSSMKYNLFDWKKKVPLASGIVERVTVGGSFIVHEVPGREKVTVKHECPDNPQAIKLVLDTLTGKDTGVIGSLSEINAVGHRVVHGGEKFVKSVIITSETVETFRQLSDL